MDPELHRAACLGDVGFLKRAMASKHTVFFLLTHGPGKLNIFHIALWNSKFDFVREAIKLQPKELVHQLLSQQDMVGWIPLHVAASRPNCLEPVMLILDFFKSFSKDDAKPWLTLTDRTNYPPLHLLLHKQDKNEDDEKCAMELLSLDFELQCNMVDSDGTSPLFFAVKNGFNHVAEKILMSSFKYSVGGKNGSTPLHFAPKCSGPSQAFWGPGAKLKKGALANAVVKKNGTMCE